MPLLDWWLFCALKCHGLDVCKWECSLQSNGEHTYHITIDNLLVVAISWDRNVNITLSNLLNFYASLKTWRLDFCWHETLRFCSKETARENLNWSAARKERRHELRGRNKSGWEIFILGEEALWCLWFCYISRR